jgi:uncharacterized protein involved in type VI secretion and phage assembly
MMLDGSTAAAVPMATVDRHYGKHRGLVTDNQDPLDLGRVRAQVPEVLGDVDSGWALPALPYAGENQGSYTVPAVGAGVWIEFEAGDVSRPIWTGCWWSSGQLPTDQSGTGAKPPLKILRSGQGLLVALDDDAQTITLSDGNGSNLITLKAGDGQIKVQAATKVVVEAPQIELVDGASHALVFGDSLLQYLSQVVNMFNSHLHPGETAAGIPVSPAPPLPPLTPPAPDLLSVKVKTG